VILTPTQAQFDRFAQLSGDTNPIHVDPDFAARSGFGRTVAHGAMLTTWLLAAQGPQASASGATAIRFPAPAFAGEPLAPGQTQGGEPALIRQSDGEPVCILEQAASPGLPDTPGDTLPAGVPLAPGMATHRRIGLGPQAREGLAEVLPPALAGRLTGMLAGRALILGGWSALLGIGLPGLGTNYLKQQTAWLAPESGPVPDGMIDLTVRITGLRPASRLVDLATLATLPDSGAPVAFGRALVSARDVAGAFAA
jgi:hypothetical protein